MLKTKDEIKDWLDRYKVSSYTINDDLTVDVDGSVNLMNNYLTEIPIQFGVVKGDFFCCENKLISLKGVPYEVAGTFNCAVNHLNNLNDCPQIIGYDFNCTQNPLISLSGFKCQINRDFLHNSKTHKIIELESHYYENIGPNGKGFCLWMSGAELNANLLALKLGNELGINSENKKLIKNIKV